MSNTQPPGYINPTLAPLPPGAGNPRQAAIIEQQNANDKLARLNSVGGKRKRKYKGGADAVAVPQFQMQYKPTGGPGSSPNDIIATTTKNNMQSVANSVDDSKAALTGGTRRKYKKGGNPDWIWGCYSGGKRHTKRRRNNRHSRKNHKKSRRQHRH
jgi:hypothetical protein